MSGITGPFEAYFKDGVWGWDGIVWRKLPLVFGYSDRYAELEQQDNVAAGDRALIFSTVPEGEIWVLTQVSAWCTTANPAVVKIQAFTDEGWMTLKVEAYPTASLTVDFQTQMVLKKGDYLYVLFSGCVSNDDIRACAMGYKMKVAE